MIDDLLRSVVVSVEESKAIDQYSYEAFNTRNLAALNEGNGEVSNKNNYLVHQPLSSLPRYALS